MSNALNHILCIDDEQDILDVAEMSLETIGGFRVSLCDNSQEGVRQAEILRPDMILLDVMMPETDGPATLKALRDNPSTCGIPVVFMTAKVQPSEVSRYMALGIAGVIPKPFDPMLLPDQVRAYWKAHHEGK